MNLRTSVSESGTGSARSYRTSWRGRRVSRESCTERGRLGRIRRKWDELHDLDRHAWSTRLVSNLAGSRGGIVHDSGRSTSATPELAEAYIRLDPPSWATHFDDPAGCLFVSAGDLWAARFRGLGRRGRNHQRQTTSESIGRSVGRSARGASRGGRWSMGAGPAAGRGWVDYGCTRMKWTVSTTGR